MQRVAFYLLCIAFVACTKQGDGPPVRNAGSAIHINEVFAIGSSDENELEAPGDWLELYNAGPAVQLATGEWFLTDERDDLLKYELSGITLREQEYARVWCDGQEGEEGDGMHASFRLASKGEWLALVQVINGRPCIIDSVCYAQQKAADGSSASRYPDGGRTWLTVTRPTPGEANEAHVQEQ